MHTHLSFVVFNVVPAMFLAVALIGAVRKLKAKKGLDF